MFIETLIKLFYFEPLVIKKYYYYDVQSYDESNVDIKARKPALKASGHVLADRLVGSLFHCLRVALKNRW